MSYRNTFCSNHREKANGLKKTSVATEEILASISVMAVQCINRFKNFKISLGREALEDLQDKPA
jgi:hypothetical protein